MGKTADLTVVQKTTIDTLNKEDCTYLYSHFIHFKRVATEVEITIFLYMIYVFFIVATV